MWYVITAIVALVAGFLAGRSWGRYTSDNSWREAVLQNHRQKKAEAKMTARKFGESQESWLGGK